MRHRIRGSAASLALALAATCLLPAANSLAQDAAPQETTTTELSDSTLNLQGLGIELSLPVGSTSTTHSLSRETKAEILGKDNAWRLTVTTQTSANKELEAKEAAEKILANLQKIYAIDDVQRPDAVIGTFARIMDPIEKITFKGGEAFRFFIYQPADRPSAPDTVRGVGVVKIGAGQMLVWDMHAPEANYDQAKDALNAMLGSVRTTATPLAFADRKLAIKTGQRLLDSLTDEEMKSIFQNYGERWYRLYETLPDSTEKEIGYRKIRAWTGHRSELGGLSARERDEAGYLVEIQARTLGEETSGMERVVYDSKGTYFVSEDKAREAWNLVVVIKQGGRNSAFTEVGAREGFEELLVTTDDPSGPGKTLQIDIKEEGYLPMPFSLILPTLLTETEATGDVAFYTYRSDASAVTFRHDAVRHDPDNPGGWIHRSSVSADSPQIVKYLDKTGRIQREELPGDRQWVKTDIQELSRIWRQKNLPMD